MQLGWGVAGALWGRYSFEISLTCICADTVTITRTQHLPRPYGSAPLLMLLGQRKSRPQIRPQNTF